MKKCQLDLTDEQTVHAHKHENLVLDGGGGGGVGGGVWILSLHWASNGCIGLTFITEQQYTQLLKHNHHRMR